jgi:hypothetical protein
MDGLQVLAIVRRRFPELRTVVLSGAGRRGIPLARLCAGRGFVLAQVRHAAEPADVPGLHRIAAGREEDGGGFRGIQSKSLMDIIQMECLSRSSSVLRITRGPLVAKLWIQDGELIDAEAEGAAARRRSGAFWPGNPARLKICPPNPAASAPSPNPSTRCCSNPRRRLMKAPIPTSPNRSSNNCPSQDDVETRAAHPRRRGICRAVPPEKGKANPRRWARRSTEHARRWTRHADGNRPQTLGEKIEAGPLSHVAGHNLERQLLVAARGKILSRRLAAGGRRQPLFEKSKKLVASWDS